MGRKATSLLLRRSPAEVMRLAVTGLPAGMSTLAPLPATSLTTAKACGGAGWKFVIVRSPDWITVRALISWLATTTLMPAVLPWMSGRLAIPAAVMKARTASTAPITMQRRPRRGLARAEVAIDNLMWAQASQKGRRSATNKAKCQFADGAHSTRTASTTAVLTP